MIVIPFKRVIILGDSPLVEEYASLCHSKGFEVAVKLNAEFGHVKLAKGFKKIAKPTRSADIALELTNLSLATKKANLLALDATLPQGIPVISSSVAVTALEQTSWISHPERLVGIGALPSLISNSLIELAPSFVTSPEALKRAKEFIVAMGKTPAVVKDSIGLVLPRILCTLANEACFALGEGVASVNDIDTAMKLGTNYPWGPIKWAEKIGFRHVRAVMESLHAHFGEDRYRLSPVLRNAAIQNRIAGIS